MADFVKGLFGGSKPSPSAGDSDFADFAGAPDPSPASAPVPSITGFNLFATPTGYASRPYTAWYRVWERTSPSDFKQEAIVIPITILVLILHLWGRRKNRRVARNWATAHGPALSAEFAEVGFGGPGRKPPTVEQVESSGLAQAMASQSLVQPADMLKEKTAQEFACYATGRQNTAFVDIKLQLFKRYSPATLIVEYIMSVFFESMKPPSERIDAVSYSFDGREKDLVPVATQMEQDELEAKVKGLASVYDGFVWAVVHKDEMRTLRDDRYDLSLTTTKDNPKLPPWATMMSESAEITEALLTKDLIKAINAAGESSFRSLIVSDQPLEKPTKLQETVPRKRVALSMHIPSGASSSPAAFDKSLPLFEHFLRLPDSLAAGGRFRPEVMRKIRATREVEVDKIRRKDEEERAEDRKAEADRKKKADRDAKLSGLSADEQRKFLEKEREKESRKASKKMTKRG